MKMTNDTYCVTFNGKRITERYYRDEHGWVKVSNKGRVFRATAEQVLNHVLPALAFGGELGLTVTVEHTETPYWQTPAAQADPPCPPPRTIRPAKGRTASAVGTRPASGERAAWAARRGGAASR